MKYDNTFFAQQPMSMYGGGVHFGRVYWMHMTLDVLDMQTMNERADDGTFDVLGATRHQFGRLLIGTQCRNGLQLSIREHARKLKDAGARIVKQTKNTLVAVYRNERVKFAIKPTSVYRPLL